MIWLLREFSRSLPQPARCATWCHLAENENSCENSSQDSKFSCRSVEKRKIDTNLIALDAGNAIAALLLLDFASQFTSRVTMAIWHKHLFFDACNHYPSEYLQANCQAVSLGLTRSCLGSFGGRARKKPEVPAVASLVVLKIGSSHKKLLGRRHMLSEGAVTRKTFLIVWIEFEILSKSLLVTSGQSWC